MPDIQLLAPRNNDGSPQSPFTYYRARYKSILDRTFIPIASELHVHLKLVPIFFSDHLGQLLTISSQPIFKIDAHNHWSNFMTWQPPDHLFHTEEFQQLLVSTVETVQCEFSSSSPLAKWSIIKTHLKNELLNSFINNKKTTNNKVGRLSKQLIDELNQQNPDNQIILHTRAQIHQLMAQKMATAFKKVKTANIQNRERPTKIFFRKLHTRRIRGAISGLTDPGGSSRVLTEPHEVIDSLAKHYQNRFSSRAQSSESDINSLLMLQENNQTCNNDTKGPIFNGLLDNAISDKEILDSITGHHGSLSSGPDGLNSVFYKTFVKLIIPLLVLLYNYMANAPNHIPMLSYIANANLTPIPKRSQKKPTNTSKLLKVDEFRIVSTINFDLRVLARIINNRLGEVAGGVLHPYIFGVKGRNINHSALLQSMATHNALHPKGTQFQIIKADLSNAFDFTSIHHLLQHFFHKFGRTLTSRLLVFLLLNRRLQIKLSRRCSYIFGMVNGILQGCPLSSTLFSIYMEPLMNTLDRRIHGLPISGSPSVVKSLSYIDDLVVGCRDIYDVRTVFRTLREFHGTTGSVINMEKTFSMHLMPPGSKYDRSFLSRNSPKVISQKILGHYLLPNQKSYRNAQKQAFLDDTASFLKVHHDRGLSLMGRVQVVNAMVISKLSYHCIFLLFSCSWIRSFYKLIRSFLWSTMAHVSMAKLFLPRTYGGLGLINLKLYFVLRRFRFSFSIPQAFKTRSGLATALQEGYNLHYKLNEALRISLSQLLGHSIDSSANLGYGAALLSMCSTHHYSKLPVNYLISIPRLHLHPGALNFLFMLQHGSLPVAHHLHYTRHMSAVPLSCKFCSGGTETLTHLFTDCPTIRSIISGHLRISGVSTGSWNRILFTRKWHKDELKKIKIVVTMAFAIWKVRCQMVFKQDVSASDGIIHEFNNIFVRDHLYLLQSDYSQLW